MEGSSHPPSDICSSLSLLVNQRLSRFFSCHTAFMRTGENIGWPSKDFFQSLEPLVRQKHWVSPLQHHWNEVEGGYSGAKPVKDNVALSIRSKDIYIYTFQLRNSVLGIYRYLYSDSLPKYKCIIMLCVMLFILLFSKYLLGTSYVADTMWTMHLVKKVLKILSLV